jgi:hypothetical protein
MTTLPEENTIIGVDENIPTTPTGIAIRAGYRQLRVLGSILLLGAVWYALFLWGLVTTQEWLAWWNTGHVEPTQAWQTVLANLLQTSGGIYLPAFGLVLISMALFFYRIPRVPGRLSVSLEFAVTTVLFVTINLLTMQLLRRLAQLAAQMGPAELPSANFDPIYFMGELGLAITFLMLAGLFWLQGTGVLRSKWRQWRREAVTA